MDSRSSSVRVSASLLKAVGLEECVTDSLKDYEELVVRYLKKPKLLKELKTKLKKNRLTTPLFDTESRVRELEKAYEGMWERYIKGEKVREIEIR